MFYQYFLVLILILTLSCSKKENPAPANHEAVIDTLASEEFIQKMNSQKTDETMEKKITPAPVAEEKQNITASEEKKEIPKICEEELNTNAPDEEVLKKTMLCYSKFYDDQTRYLDIFLMMTKVTNLSVEEILARLPDDSFLNDGQTRKSIDEQFIIDLCSLNIKRQESRQNAKAVILDSISRHLDFFNKFKDQTPYKELLIYSFDRFNTNIAFMDDDMGFSSFLPDRDGVYPYKKERTPRVIYEEEIQENMFGKTSDEILSSDSYKAYLALKEAKKTPFKKSNYKAHPRAVKVYFFDDYYNLLEFPELSYFQDKTKNLDLTDGSDSVLAASIIDPYTNELIVSHGTHTSGSFLSTLARYHPWVLKEKKLDLGLLKAFSDEESAFYGNPIFPHAELISYTKLDADIVSRSTSTEPFDYENDKNELLERKYLEILAAGNKNMILDSNDLRDGSDCYADYPKEYRPSEKILCVGALEEGVIKPRLASYTNFGPFVDVYTYESYNRMCPNGTSCATPGITAAATLIKAKFPKLTSAQLKKVIVQASIKKEVFKKAGLDTEKVNFFDPTTMMERAYTVAANMLKKKR